MNTQPKGPTGGSEDNVMGVFYAFMGLILIGMILYYYFHSYIINFIFYVKYYELKVISYFDSRYTALIYWIQGVISTKNITFSALAYLAEDVGDALRYPISMVLVCMTAIAYYVHPDSKFKETETMKSLIAKLRDSFPFSKPIAGCNLAKMHIGKGEWRMAMTPVEFAKKHHLLSRNSEGALQVNKIKAKMLFVSQLDDAWTGVENLQPYEKIIFALLAAYINYKRDFADELAGEISSAIVESDFKKFSYAKVNKAIKKYAKTPAVMEAVDKHAYRLTVFTELLIQARCSGIVANASYLWLKKVDRRLWYTLNNVGRIASFVEASAVRAHW